MTTKPNEIDPLNYLGIDHDKYMGQIKAMALAQPTQYTAMRQSIIDKVKNEAVQNLFKTCASVLTKGQINGISVFNLGGITGKTLKLAPSVPDQLVAEQCLSMSKTLNSMIDDMIKTILPDFSKEVGSRFAEIGRVPETA